MRRFPRAIAAFLAMATALAVAPSIPAAAAPTVRNPGDPHYRTELSTGGQGHVWAGTHRIAFTNLEIDPLSTIYLRLWSNGVLGCAAGSIQITNLQGGTVVATTQRCTAVEIALDAPLAPGARTSISMDLRIEVPPENDRFGFHKGLALVGTALPTLAIHDDAGWHLDPFVDSGGELLLDRRLVSGDPRGAAGTRHADHRRLGRPAGAQVPAASRGHTRHEMCATSRGRRPT